jgi:hypothetical protein
MTFLISLSLDGPSRFTKSQHLVVVKLSFTNIEFINQFARVGARGVGRTKSEHGEQGPLAIGAALINVGIHWSQS